MKKFLSLALALTLCASLAACSNSGSNSASNSGSDAASTSGSGSSSQTQTSDLQYVKDKGTLVVGITEFEPMDYQDTDGNWIGFDADLATAFAESLGVDVQFQVIDWDNKVMELDGKTIDVVWNGMTLNDETKASMECSNPYFDNAQVVIVPADKAADYQTVESVQDLAFSVEVGSAAKEQADEYGFNYTEAADQATALLEVSSGTADAAIIDYLMSVAMTGEGTSYADLTATVSLNTEQYGVGFRKGSDLVDAFNEFWKQAVADGTVEQIAATYGLQDAVILE